MKGENNIWKRSWLGLAYLNPVLSLYRNHPIDLLHKLVEWFLCNSNTGLSGKVGAYVLVFISNSIFHFSLSCLEKNYDLSLKVAKITI